MGGGDLLHLNPVRWMNHHPSYGLNMVLGGQTSELHTIHLHAEGISCQMGAVFLSCASTFPFPAKLPGIDLRTVHQLCE